MVRFLRGTLACLVLLPSAALGQSLADAAKRADEQRKHDGAAAEKLSNRDLPGHGVLENYVLSDALLETYSYVWEHVITLRTKKIAVDRYLIRYEAEAKSSADLERAYQNDSEINGLLTDRGITAETYFIVQAAFKRAMIDSEMTDDALDDISRARRINAMLVKEGNWGHNELGHQERLQQELDLERRLRPR